MPQKTRQNRPSHQQTPSSHSDSPQSQQSTLVPGSGPAPQQQMLNAFSRLRIDQPSSQPSQNSAQASERRYISHLFLPLEGQDIQVLSYPLPSRQEFLEELKGWSDHINLKPNFQISQIGDHILDLYDLYSEVMALGGVGMVRRYELWGIIAVRMRGFQRNSNSSADSGQTAAHATEIKLLYEKSLESSEIALVSGIVKKTIAMLQTSNQLPLLFQQLMLQLVEMAPIPADTMRNQGLPDALIQQVETHRPFLRARWQQLRLQRKALLQQQSPAPPTSLLNQQEMHAPRQSYPPTQLQDVAANGNTLTQNASTPAAGILGGGQRPMIGHGAGHWQMNGLIGSSRLSSGTISNAIFLLNQLRRNISRDRNLAPLGAKHVPETERMRFIETLENIHKSLTEMDKVLPMYFSCTNDDTFAKGILNMLDLVERQRGLLQSPTPTYIFDLHVVEKLHSSVTEARGRLQSVLRQIAMLRAATLAPERHGSETGMHGPGSVPSLCSPMDRIVMGNTR